MNTINPYAPPEAAVADIAGHEEAQPVRVWSGKGRIGRLRYLAHMTGAYLLVLPVMFLAGILEAMIGSQVLTIGLTILVVGVYMVFCALKSIQRSHDMDWSGWMSLLALIPLVGLIWIFRRGTQGANRFGAPAPANGIGVKILGFIFPVIMIVGIVAAIALPAYQTYVQRAKAAQGR